MRFLKEKSETQDQRNHRVSERNLGQSGGTMLAIARERKRHMVKGD
jgi:hypothetical protein